MKLKVVVWKNEINKTLTKEKEDSNKKGRVYYTWHHRNAVWNYYEQLYADKLDNLEASWILLLTLIGGVIWWSLANGFMYFKLKISWNIPILKNLKDRWFSRLTFEYIQDITLLKFIILMHIKIKYTCKSKHVLKTDINKEKRASAGTMSRKVECELCLERDRKKEKGICRTQK